MTSPMPVAPPFRTVSTFGSLLFVMVLLGAAPACDDSSPNEADDNPANSCASPRGGALERDAYCEDCQFAATAQPSTCRTPRTVNACCVWLMPPAGPLARGVGLARFSSTDPTVDLACLDVPSAPAASAGTTAPMKGFVRLFSSGNDSAGVKVEVFRQNDDGSLGEAIATPSSVITTTDDAKGTKKEDLLAKCPDGGCTFRGYAFDGAVPTDTRLVVKTSDASGGPSTWAPFYESVYFSGSALVDGAIAFDPTAMAAADRSVIFAAAGGAPFKQERGIVLGEVHDCGDVRVAGAMVDVDATHDGDVVYFGEDERNPLPDASRTVWGTSTLGTFAALNVTAGVPVRVSAIGQSNGKNVLLGTDTLQAFAGAVSSVRLRGRRPWQN